MKQNYSRVVLLLSIITITVFSAPLTAHQLTAGYSPFTTAVTDDANFKLDVIKTQSHIAINVSFNGNEGTTGTLKILNANNEQVTQLEINLKQQPDYATIGLDEFANGTYTAQLTTQSGVHTSHFIIQ